MKPHILLFALLFISTSFLHAQENDKLKNVQEETITKTITVKGVTEETTETTVVKEGKQIIKIKDTGEENQDVTYSEKEKVEKQEVKSKTAVNEENAAAIEEIKRKQKEEIEASKKEQLAKYEAERIEMENKRPEEFKKKKDTLNNN